MEEYIKINVCLCSNNFDISLQITNELLVNIGLECFICGLGGDNWCFFLSFRKRAISMAERWLYISKSFILPFALPCGGI